MASGVTVPRSLQSSNDIDQIPTRLNPIIKNPLVNGVIITDVALIMGDNTINHKLGRTLQGWLVIGSNAVASIYDKQSTNSTTSSTLVLTSSAVVTVNLYVF